MRNPVAIVFCLAILISPWLLGGVLPHVRTGLLVVATLLVLVAIGKQLLAPAVIRFPSIWIWLSLGVAYAIFQLVPGMGDLRGLATGAAASSFAEDNRAVSAGEKILACSTALSVHPSSSRAGLCDLLLAVAVFASATCLLTYRTSIFAIMMTVAFAGVAISFFGIIQKLSWDGQIYWSYELTHGGWSFGPFVNKNNAGGFLVACMSAAIFILSYQIFKWEFKASRPSDSIKLKGAQQVAKTMGLKHRLFALIAGLQTQHLYSLAVISFIAAGILTSLSRGAVLAMVLSGLAFVLLLMASNRWASVLVLLVAVGAMGLTIYSEQSDIVTSQLKTLTDPALAGAPRIAHWSTALPYVKQHWMWGSGLGTYAYMYPLYQEGGTLNKWFMHAENVYFETLAEMGVTGLVLLLGVVWLVASSSFRLLRSDTPFERALGIATICGLLGQLVAACFDFGIYQPANLVLVATLFGMATGRGLYMRSPSYQTELQTIKAPRGTKSGGSTPLYQVVKQSQRQPERPNVRNAWSIAMALFLLPLVLGCAWAIKESHGVECLRAGARKVQLFNQHQGNNPSYLDQAEPLLKRALAIRPDDSETLFQTGEFHLARFRQQMVRTLLGTPESPEMQTELSNGQSEISSAPANPSTTGSAIIETTKLDDVWNVTAPASINRMIHVARRLDPDSIEQWKTQPEYASLETAWDWYLQAENSCSYLPQTQLRLAQLSIVMEDGANENQRLSESLTRWPDNYKTLYECGLLYLNSGQPELACDAWHRSLTISRRYEPEIIEYGQNELSMKQFFEQVLLQDPANMIRIARNYFRAPEQALPRKLLMVHTGRLIEQSTDDAANKFYLMGQVQQLSLNYPAAIGNFAKAVELNSENVDYRLPLAICYYESKNFEAALDQLNVCRLLRSERQAEIVRWIKRIERERERESVQRYSQPNPQKK